MCKFLGMLYGTADFQENFGEETSDYSLTSVVIS
jgi:hypothetical protein